MEKLNIQYSLKNIPIPPKEVYLKSLLDKIIDVIRRMRWKAFHFDCSSNPSQEDMLFCNIKSKKFPPRIKGLEDFEKDLLNILTKISFKKFHNNFQRDLKKDINFIRTSGKKVIFSDKTKNLYLIKESTYDKMLLDNIVCKYSKANNSKYNDINEEARGISKILKLDKKIEVINKKEAFISIKDHKKDFMTRPKCRLINPAKSELGKVSKVILDKIIKQVKSKRELVIWKNSFEVVDWFRMHTCNNNKIRNARFIQLDIEDFYASISSDLLNKAIDFARSYVDITDLDRDIIFHARKTLLFSKDNMWIKTANVKNAFDVSMGSFDGGSICDLIGLYIMDILYKSFPNIHFGIYKDDVLGLSFNTNGHMQDRLRKDIISVFREFGLRITIDVNIRVVNYLDVTLDLINMTYTPFRKPNDRLSFINVNSCHPPFVFRNLVKNTSERLSELSSDIRVFNSVAPLYNKALKDSGFQDNIKYIGHSTRLIKNNRGKNRKRNIIWFLPVYSPEVNFNIGRYFLHLIDKHFDASNRYRKLFNRHNLKVGYSTTKNFKEAIKHMNNDKKIINTCSCRIKDKCPLNGECLAKHIVYEAKVNYVQDNKHLSKIYIGGTENFKQRYYNHVSSFRHIYKRKDTSLSNFIWILKEKNMKYKITWRILKQCRPYKSGCSLCKNERWLIWLNSFRDDCLNRRFDIFNTCNHIFKRLLYSWTQNYG